MSAILRTLLSCPDRRIPMSAAAMKSGIDISDSVISRASVIMETTQAQRTANVAKIAISARSGNNRFMLSPEIQSSRVMREPAARLQPPHQPYARDVARIRRKMYRIPAAVSTGSDKENH